MVAEKCIKCADRLNIITIVVCLILAAFMFWVGYLGGSHALMAGAFYSLQYVVVAIMVSWGSSFSKKKANEKYPYGYGKLEYVVTSAISLFIIASMLVLLYVAGTRFLMGPAKPTMLAFWGAVITCLTTYILAGYLKCNGKMLNSPAIISNAKHLHMDTISAICLTIAIILTIMGLRHLDSIVAIVEAIHILITSAELFGKGIKGLMDTSLPEIEIKQIKNAILNVKEVKGLSSLMTREMGRKKQVDCEIQLEGDVTLDRTDSVKKEIRRSIAQVLNSSVITNISFAPLDTAFSDEKWKVFRIAKALSKYYSSFIKSHRLTFGEQSIAVELSFLPDIPTSSWEDIRGRIADDLRREITGTKISVKMKQENNSN